MSVLSTRDKLRAEKAAADATQRLTALGGQSVTLSAYVADLGARLVAEGVETGLELKSYGQFMEMGLRARHRNDTAITAGEAAQRSALDTLAAATQRHKSLREATDQAQHEAAAEAERMAERRR